MSENSPYEAPESDVAVSSGASKLTLKQIYFSFEGRVPRKVYWLYGFLGLIGAMIAVMIVLGILSSILGEWVMILALPFYIVMLWAMLAVQVKRWHDRNKSGWWVLIGIVPIIGIWALIECGFLETVPGDNQFGPAPADY